jgi:serine protease Do
MATTKKRSPRIAWSKASLAVLVALLLIPAANWADDGPATLVEESRVASQATDEAAGKKVPKTQPVTLPPSSRLRMLFSRTPEDVNELKAMEAHIQKLSERVKKCTVAVRLQGGMGSGVIVSPDGYVMTAGHVGGRPGRDVTVLMHDARALKGKTLGANYGIDSGLIKLNSDGPWPYAELGRSADLKPGEWCLGTGHPGGFQSKREAPVRVGRILHNEARALITDITLVGGDSGGPLFDMAGRVIGIHSRIGEGLRSNLHVPVDTYRKTWDRLVDGDAWGGMRPGGPVIGVVSDRDAKDARIAQVIPDSPADEAGIRKDDVITRFDGKKITTFEELSEAVGEKDPGDKVEIELLRGDEKIVLQLTVGSLKF